MATRMNARNTIQDAKNMKQAASNDGIGKVRRLQPDHSVLLYPDSEGRKPYKLVIGHETELDVFFNKCIEKIFRNHVSKTVLPTNRG